MIIRIKDLRLRTTIGIYDWEREQEQDIVINAGIVFDGRAAADSDEIARWNPHRGNMAFIDAIVWVGDDFRQGLAIHKVRDD